MRYLSLKYGYAVCAALLILCLQLHAAAVEVTDYSQPYMEQSLGSNDMTAIVQDQDGFIWVATHNELARFDGHSFVPVASDRSSEIFHGGNLVNTMKITSDDILLIGTSRGFFRYDIRNDRLAHTEKTDSLKIFAMEHAGEKDCWFVNSDKGLLLYDSPTDTFTLLREYLPAAVDEPLTSLKSFQIGLDGCLYFSDSRYLMKLSHDMSRTDTLCTWKGDSWRAEVHPPRMFLYDRKQLVVSDMSLNDSGRISDMEVTDICLWDGSVILGIRGKGIEKVTYADDGSFVRENVRLSRYYDDMSGTVNVFFEDSDGNLWVGTRNGLFLMSRQEKSKFSNLKSDIGQGENNALSHNTVSDILVENDDRIWLATAGGLDLLTFDETSDDGYSIRHFRDGRYQKNNDYHKIEQLCPDARNEMWCGTKAGILFFDLKTCSFISHPEIEAAFDGCSFIRAIWRDSYDDMWVGFENGGLFRYRSEEKRVEKIRFPSGEYPDNCTSICGDRDGHVWVGTKGNSLFRMDFTGSDITAVEQYPLSPETNPASARITYIYPDIFGNIWVGTADGMYRYSKERDEFDRIELGVPASRPYICGIIGDDDGNLWIPTVSGIYKYSMWDAAGTAFYRRNHFARYGFVYGCAKGGDGFIYLSGINGLTWFYPEDITSDDRKYDISFLDFKADGKSLMQSVCYHGHGMETRKIILPYRHNRVSFSFSVLDYAHRNEIQYCYMLEGADEDWIYPASEPRNISYGHLKPGLYTLRMRSTDRAGIWQDNERVQEIRIRPPVMWSWYSISAYLLIILAISYVLLLYFRKKAREKTDAVLHRLRMQFYRDISYNMKNPVTLIESPLQKLLAGSGKMSWSQEKALLETVHRGCVSISMLAEQLADFSEIDSGDLKLNLTMADFMQFSAVISEKFRPLFDRKGISFEFISERKPVFMSFDSGRMERVFYELLSNAYKFTPAGGHVVCACRKDRNGFVRVEVSDSGSGMAPEKLEKIFERFWTDGGQQSGAGMGLPLAKEFVILHGGSMEVSSTPGKGLSIFFTLPVHDESHVLPESGGEIPGISAHLSEYLEVMESGIPADRHSSPGAPLIFIVSKDKELRKFLTGILMPEYNIETFPSPDSVFDKISQELPSLVISGMVFNDGKEGLKLCQQVKSSVRTGHIPFMFLTAYSQDRLRKDGYESGADAYVTKPFEVDYLLVRISRLIKSREAIKAKARREIIANPAEVSELSADDKFLAKATAVVERNLANEDFSVDAFAKEMCTSSSMLYRRIKFLTNSSPNEFIRRIRMKRAAQLLKIHACSVSEVAFRVGFSDTRYFSTCFKKEFGRTPTAWQQENPDEPQDLSR